MQRKTNEAVNGEWRRDGAQHTFDRFKSRQKDGSAVSASVTLTLLQPEHFCCEDKQVYLVIVSLDKIATSDAKSSKSSRSSRSSCSGHSSAHSSRHSRQLSPVAEADDKEDNKMFGKGTFGVVSGESRYCTCLSGPVSYTHLTLPTILLV